MFSSIRARLWLSYAALIATALIIVTAVLTVVVMRNPPAIRQAVARLVAAENLLLRAPRLEGRVGFVAEAFDVRILLFSTDGTLITDTGSPSAALQVALPQAGERTTRSVRDLDGRSWLFTRTQLDDGKWLLTATPRPTLIQTLNLLRDELWRPIIRGAFVTLLLALLMAYVLAAWIADPLQRLVLAARTFQETDAAGRASMQEADGGDGRRPSGHVQGSGPREVQSLVAAFNAMTDRVQESQRSQKEFVANVSHELKTPLTSIQGFAQAILDGTADDSQERHHAAQIIVSQAGRMHRLAVDLLDLSRLDAGTFDLRAAPTDLGGLLAAVRSGMLGVASSSDVDLELNVDPDLPPVLGDEDRLSQVFSNLVDNALKFTPRGGRVGIKADLDGGRVRVLVTDSGPGIKPEKLDRIFDRFYQADSARTGGTGHGSGLGLAIARELVQAHGGTINARSDLGHGTEFSVHLPSMAEGGRMPTRSGAR